MQTLILLGAIAMVAITIGEIKVYKTKKKYSPFKIKP